MMTPMKTLTNKKTNKIYEVIDERARIEIEKLKLLTGTEAVEKVTDYNTNKADVILSKSTGEVATTTDSAKAKPKNIRLYGKTEQDCTEGNQLFDISVIETTSFSGAVTNITEVGNSHIVVTSTDGYNGNGYVNSLKTLSQICPKLEVGKTYILSGQTQSTNKFINVGITWIFGKTQTITQEMLDSYVLFYGYDVLSGGQSVGACKIWDIQIQEGTVATEREPYTGGEASPNINYPQPLNSHGDSGSIVGKVLSCNVYNPSFRNESNGIFTMNCSSVAESNGKFTLVANGSDMYAWMVCNKGNPYKTLLHGPLMYIPEGESKISVSFTNSTFIKNFITFYDKDLISLGYKGTTSSSKSVDIFENAKYFTLRFGYGDAIVGETYKTSVMVNYGEPTEYEPYTEQPFTVLTPNGLKSIGDARDYVDFEREKFVQRIEEFVFDDSDDENWTTDSYKRYTSSILQSKPIQVTNNNGIATSFLCTHSEVVSANDTYSSSNKKIGVSISSDKTIQFHTGESELDLDAWKNRLRENPITIYYVLAEPIETPLSEEEMAQFKALCMNYPNTTIINSDNAYMEVEYVADTKMYIDNLKKKHNEDIQELKTAIIALGGII